MKFLDIVTFFLGYAWPEKVSTINGEDDLDTLHKLAFVKRNQIHSYDYIEERYKEEIRVNVHDLFVALGENVEDIRARGLEKNKATTSAFS